MDLKEDNDLLYIAKEGLKAPLPENFKPYKRRNGEIVYVNLENNEFQEEHPCDEYYKNLFLDLKRKKAQKQTSKFKKNFPIGGGSSGVNQGLNLKKNGNQGTINLDKSSISEQHDSFLSNNQDNSLTTIPTPLVNKETKQSSSNSQGLNPESRFLNYNLGEDLEGITDIDQEYNDKFFDYYKAHEKSLASLKQKDKSKEEAHENNLKNNLKKQIKDIENKMKTTVSETENTKSLEKARMRTNLESERNEKFEIEVKRINKLHFNSKKSLHEIEHQISEEMKSKEKDLNQEFTKQELVLLNFGRRINFVGLKCTKDRTYRTTYQRKRKRSIYPIPNKQRI